MTHVTRLFVYPIKSCRGIAVDSIELTARGPAFDRRYMLIDSDGKFLTQRQHPRMAMIQVAFGGEGFIVTAPGSDPLELPAGLDGNAGSECRVRIWNDTVEATLAESAINVWFSQYMGFACGLVYLADHQHRPVTNEAGAFDDEVGFADGAPVLLISEASLDELGRRLARPVAVERFRPNIVVSAATAHAEDGWSSVAIGAARLEVAWSCTRCILTTIDPATGERDADNEPMATLLSYRRRDRRVHFGQNLIPRKLGTISIGDECVVAMRSTT